MYFFEDALSYIWTDTLGYKWYRLITGSFEPTNPTGTIIFKGVPPLSSVTDNPPAAALGQIANARVIQDPYLEALTADLTETIIELSFLNTIDTFFLGNVNFTDFTITADAVPLDLTTFSNPNTGLYNGICFFTTAGINTFTLTIPNQATTDGISRFSIGALIGGNRSIFNPRRPTARTIIEPSDVIRFDDNNKEINNSGRSYHVFDVDFSDIETTEMEALRILENNIGRDNTAVVYENYDDRETGLITERVGVFNESEKSVNLFDNIWTFKEKA